MDVHLFSSMKGRRAGDRKENNFFHPLSNFEWKWRKTEQQSQFQLRSFLCPVRVIFRKTKTMYNDKEGTENAWVSRPRTRDKQEEEQSLTSFFYPQLLSSLPMIRMISFFHQLSSSTQSLKEFWSLFRLTCITQDHSINTREDNDDHKICHSKVLNSYRILSETNRKACKSWMELESFWNDTSN